jgi:hypothetical protein
MSHHRKDPSEKAQLLQMATMWLKLAEFAEKNGNKDEPPPTL